MTRYQLLKLISWAGTLHSRKTLQKVVYLLQTAGCPFDAEYYLDIIGPYSEDVRHRIDEAVVLGLLEEQASGPLYHENWSYRLTVSAEAQMAELERSDRGRPLAAEMAPFEPLARQFLPVEPKALELAATLHFFRLCGLDQEQALEKTRTYKRLAPDDPQVLEAVRVARLVEERARKAAA